MAFPLRTRTRGRPGRGAGVKSVAAAPSFNPLTSWTTDPVHGVWASDPLWTPPADGGAVSSWRNGGSVGGDLVQATGSKQPTYRASTAALNGQPTVQSDGTDDGLSLTGLNIAQPLYLLVIGKWETNTNSTLVATRYSSVDTDSGLRNNTVNFKLGVATGFDISAFNTNAHLFTCVLNNASSSASIDGAAAATGTTGANNITGIDLFNNAANHYAAAHLGYVALFTTDPTAQPEWADFTSWVETTYGLVIA